MLNLLFVDEYNTLSEPLFLAERCGSPPGAKNDTLATTQPQNYIKPGKK